MGPDIVISAAIPALAPDAAVFSGPILKSMEEQLDFFNLMSYDYMNRNSDETYYQAGGLVVDEDMYMYTVDILCRLSCVVPGVDWRCRRRSGTGTDSAWMELKSHRSYRKRSFCL